MLPVLASGPIPRLFVHILAINRRVCKYLPVRSMSREPPMPPNFPHLQHRNLPMLMLRGRERVISYFRPLLKAQGITEQQWRVVRVLLDVPALEPREIAELCSISSPSLVGVLT